MTLPRNEGLEPLSRASATDADREVAKVTATFLNGLAVGLAVVGGVAPALNAIYATEEPQIEGWVRGLISLICLIVAGAIHSATRAYLRRELRK